MNDYAASNPPAGLLGEQASWLAPARSRLLRRVTIARRRRILDVACGPGAVSGELAARGAAGCTVVALDRSLDALREIAGSARDAGVGRATHAPLHRVCATAHRLPFPPDSFDLAFCQFALMWVDAARVVSELARVLAPGGAVVAIEPDYGGMMEYPAEIATRELWLSGFARARAEPEIGRKLLGLFGAAGFQVHTELLDRLVPPSSTRFALLRGLPLTEAERHQVDCIEAQAAAFDPRTVVTHLPIFLVTAELR